MWLIEHTWWEFPYRNGRRRPLRELRKKQKGRDGAARRASLIASGSPVCFADACIREAARQTRFADEQMPCSDTLTFLVSRCPKLCSKSGFDGATCRETAGWGHSHAEPSGVELLDDRHHKPHLSRLDSCCTPTTYGSPSGSTYSISRIPIPFRNTSGRYF